MNTQQIFLDRLQKRIEAITATNSIEQCYITGVDFEWGNVGTVRVFHAKTLAPCGSLWFSFDTCISLNHKNNHVSGPTVRRFQHHELAAAIDYAFSCFQL